MKGIICFFNTFFVVISVSTCSSAVDDLHYVGCYDPIYALRQHYHHHTPSITLAKCMQYCLALKTRFAGVEASENVCYCGEDISEKSLQKNDTFCNEPCPDDSLRTCGGNFTLSLYEILGGSAEDEHIDVDFLLGLSIGVRLYDSSDGFTFDTLMTTTNWVYSVDYHFSKNLIFAYHEKKLLKEILEPRCSTLPRILPTTNQLVINSSPCEGFAVDWVNDRIYWADCSRPKSTAIMAMGLNGEAQQTVMFSAELAGKNIKRMELDPYKRMVFWIADGVIQSCKMSGESFNPNISLDEVIVRALALDLRLRRVYYIGTKDQSSSLFSVDYTGSDEETHLSIPQFSSVYGLSILGEKVLWVNYVYSKDVVYEAPLNATGVEDIKELSTIDRAVWHMRAVHPSLQRRPKIDPCLDLNCEHGCVSHSVTSAKCKCPPGQALNSDGVSCHSTV